jgi:hypothetical protein
MYFAREFIPGVATLFAFPIFAALFRVVAANFADAIHALLAVVRVAGGVAAGAAELGGDVAFNFLIQ